MDVLPVLFLTGLVVGYFVLAGCDIGLGMLLPHLARRPAERRRVAAALAPYFLGSEVWLVAAVGVVAGLFPELKSAVLVGLWPVFVAVLAGWLCRDAGLWFRARVDSAAWRRCWDAAIVAGSWVLALGWGLVFGALLSGGKLAHPFPVACAAAVAALFALRGAAFGAERLVPAAGEPPHGGAAGDDAECADVAARATRVLARVALGAVAIAAAAALLPGGGAADRPWAAAAVAAGLLAVLAATSGLSGPRWSRHTSAIAMALPAACVAAAVDLPITPAPSGTLVLVGIAVVPALPVMIGGQVLLYRALRRPAVPSGFFG
ncbi:cytochrome d ubiquinol oxidase subunit II [Marinitenerispora sediminis]|uniref:Cytochrome BD ubiquinol oxidase subunit II n=1 Tax=Marinitenerispora sediminis TaxID=1931232 RepID=A0A368SXW8_9ACTN|nr:cytochrome d ubiquinol oxidase subunit II [Marinitenerispora sediminis]RCV47332.1 cytochrome BD ubiquinol oxidase subunit II [Marinitenerispora sediminis]RCV47379.1 cytochrome BD ubiquinol oxidase subunit II [Marinitenerispora sediminis]RCV47711.1 cytochrome BD ubiquinol oxidase subunit II [Marinitenerispora sediminis]